ncbi:MAG: hypothetical protein J6C55_04410, partial [Oscillospiraceae bacterium]|nr:hypothetical protein [Oscillospiraceae bacterium]
METTEPNYNTTTKQYEISSKEELYWFAKMINGEDGITNPGGRTTNAILINDIEFNKKDEDQTNLGAWKTWGEDYAKNLKEGSNTEPSTGSLTNPSEGWTPIGDGHIVNGKTGELCVYTGEFNGAGHTISGLFCNVYNDSGNAYAGLFGYVGSEGKIENLGIKNSFIRAKGSGSGDGDGGGLIGFCPGTVTSCYSSGCTVVGYGSGSGSGYGGGLIGDCYGTVTSCYSSGCEVVGSGSGYGSGYGGGLIGDCYGGSVTNSYSTNTEIKATGSTEALRGGICGQLYYGTINNCYYLEFDGLKGTGNENDVTGKTVEEFKNETVRDKLNTGAGSEVFKLNPKEDGHRYLLLYWEPEVELKIPVRVKINYDPSNNLESLVSKNFKHEFFRKKTDGSSWEDMLQNIHYFYTVSPVENSIKINPDGSKTQDFIFNYYI